MKPYKVALYHLIHYAWVIPDAKPIYGITAQWEEVYWSTPKCSYSSQLLVPYLSQRKKSSLPNDHMDLVPMGNNPVVFQMLSCQ
jgi:hypothetical protein